MGAIAVSRQALGRLGNCFAARVVIRRERTPPILERLSLDVEAWTALVTDFGRMFYVS
jgi:hypothetical protein